MAHVISERNTLFNSSYTNLHNGPVKQNRSQKQISVWEIRVNIKSSQVGHPSSDINLTPHYISHAISESKTLVNSSYTNLQNGPVKQNRSKKQISVWKIK